MPWCPKCKSEYREGFTECATCHVPLVDSLPGEDEIQPQDAAQPEQQEELPQFESPIAVYMADRRVDAEMVRDMLADNGITAGMRQVMTQQSGAVSGRRARYGVEVVVDAGQTAPARALIDEMKNDLENTPMDEDELARLAEEQAMETPEQPMEDNTSFKMLPVVAAVIVVALMLLYLVAR